MILVMTQRGEESLPVIMKYYNVGVHDYKVEGDRRLVLTRTFFAGTPSETVLNDVMEFNAPITVMYKSLRK
jgi:hypothetical protein